MSLIQNHEINRRIARTTSAFLFLNSLIDYMTATINQNRLVALTQKLIQTPSENPGGTEKEVAIIVKKELEACGFEVKSYEFEKDRTNVVATLKGTSSKKSLLLTPHLDTVPAGKNWKYPPFDAKIVDGKIYGRGATDCKCHVAVCLEVARMLSENKRHLSYDLIIAATSDEERGSELGLIPLLEKNILSPTHALVTDGDRFRIMTMQKGVLHLKAKIKGKRAHGAYPWKGENAIEKASKIIMDLKNFKFRFKPHPLVRPPTINIGIIKGGEGINVVPEECEFTMDIRFLPGMDPESITSDIKKLIEKTTKNYEMTAVNTQQPYEIDRNNPLVKSIESALKTNKIKPTVTGSEGATVMTFFKDRNIPAVTFGIGPDMQHETDEYIEIDSLVKGAKVLSDFLDEFEKQ